MRDISDVTLLHKYHESIRQSHIQIAQIGSVIPDLSSGQECVIRCDIRQNRVISLENNVRPLSLCRDCITECDIWNGQHEGVVILFFSVD